MKKLQSLLCLMAVVTVQMAWGQRLNLSKYNNASGLPQNYVYSIVQDNNGYIWIATAEGLARYDGVNFRNYFSRDSLADDFVYKLLIDTEGRLWCGHGNGSFSYFDGEQFNRLIVSEASSPIRDMCIDDTGNIWAIEQNKGLIRIAPDRSVSTFFDRRKFGRKIYYSLGAVNSRFLLVGTSDGLFSVKIDSAGDPQKPQSISSIPATAVNRIKRRSKTNSFFVVTDEGSIFTYSPNGTVRRLTCSDGDCHHTLIDTYSIQDIIEDSDKSIYIATWGHGVRKLQFDEKAGSYAEIMSLDENNGIDNNYVREMMIDREGIFWFATYGTGAVAWINNYFMTYKLEELGFQKNKVNAAIVVGNDVWMGLNNGIIKIQANCMSNCEFYDQNMGIPRDVAITAFCYDDDSRTLYVGTETDGIYMRRDNERYFRRLHFAASSLGQLINDIKADAHNIYIATQGGFYIYNRTTAQTAIYTTAEGLPHNNINFIYIDDLGQIWLGPKDSGICLFHNGEFEIHRLSDTPINVAGITQDRDKRLWLATYNKGALCYTNDSIVTISAGEGLEKNYCYGICADSKNRIWISHQPGLSCIDLNTSNIRIFNANTNMGAEFGRIFCDKSGDLWFASNIGVVRYMPDYDKRSDIAPKLNLTDIRISGTKMPVNKDIALPYPYDGKPVKFRFDFIGISFKDPENVKYEYWLQSQGDSEEEWIPLGTQKHKEFDYLPDGSYKLHLRAFNSDGVKSESPLTIGITIKAPFWKSFWFPIVMIVLIALIIKAITKWREKKLVEQKLTLEKEVAKQTVMLRRQNAVIERKNRDITDSINYAKRIQTAILPSPESLNDFGFAETYIYFNPRDIVSGDFYWFNRHGNTLVLCCGDCTGHGVPGAFMSMIATIIMNDIMRGNDLAKPSETLEEIDRELKKVMNKNQTVESQDGMDCALIQINLDTLEMVSAAARRPVYYVCNNRLTEIRGTRRSIGDHRNGNPFVDTVTQLSRKDWIYLTSDGYTDQFGGKTGEKYTAGKFKEFLEKISQLTADEQCKRLDSNFKEWKGDHEQIDDVIVMGIKL